MAQTWQALFALYEAIPLGWTVVGGQLVHVLCAERGVAPSRDTIDADTVVDIRADKTILARFTQHLLDLGFHSAGVSAEEHEHRWCRDEQQIDVLIATGLGRSRQVLGATGSTTVPTRGGQQALDRTQPVELNVNGILGTIPRPDLLGALVIKAAAITTGDPQRHVDDFLMLCTLIRTADRVGQAGRRDRHHLTHAIQAAHQRLPFTQVPNAATGLATLEEALRPAAPTPHSNTPPGSWTSKTTASAPCSARLLP